MFLLMQLLPGQELLEGWKPVRETTRPVARRGVFYFMKALGLGGDAARLMNNGTDGISPASNHRDTYAETFQKWTNKALSQMDDAKAAEILKAADAATVKGKTSFAEVSAIAVLKLGFGMDERAAEIFV
jgi:hypothetical protein